LDTAVVLGVDYVLLAVIRPRMRARCAERDSPLGGKGEQSPAALPLRDDRGRKVAAAAGADLDLGGDQLAGDRRAEHGVRGGGVPELLEPRDEAEPGRIEQRKLFLEPNRVVGRRVEGRASGVEVEVQRDQVR